MTIVDVTPRPWADACDGYYVLDTFELNAVKAGFTWSHAPDRVLVPLDSITAKVMVVPNLNVGYEDSMCAIPMWQAR